MGKVIGALAGLIATAVFAVAAAELLGGETGVDLLAGAKPLLPDAVVSWLALAPLASGEGAPMWRAPIVGVAVAAGAAGGLLLLVTARLSAVLLWLAFLLLLGVLVGQDLGVTGAWSEAFVPERRADLVARSGVLGTALLFALIANVVTGARRPEEHADFGRGDLQGRVVDLRDRLRAEPISRLEDAPLAPSPPARRARPPEPAPAADRAPEPLPPEPPPSAREPLRDLDRTREPSIDRQDLDAPEDLERGDREYPGASEPRDRAPAEREDERDELLDADLAPAKT